MASERGIAQTSGVARRGGVVGPRHCMKWWEERSGKSAIEGDSPVIERQWSIVVSWVARDTRNPALNLAGPSGKAKYSRETDSERVLWRKGEKHLEQEEWNRSWNHTPTSGRSIYMMWRRAFCIMILRVTVTGEVKCHEITEPKRKRAWIGRIVSGGRRETKWSTLGQVEVPVTQSGGPNRISVEKSSGWPEGRGERPIKLGDSSYSPKCI